MPRDSQGDDKNSDAIVTEAADDCVFHETPKDCTPDAVSLPAATPPHQLPEDLRACLEAFENSFQENHTWFSEALKKRYEERCPLIPSTEDILVGYVRCLLHFICHRITVPASPIFKQVTSNTCFT